MAASNRVIAGDYLGSRASIIAKTAGIQIERDFWYPLNISTVEAYEVVSGEQSKSFASGAVRGIVGGALLGPVGMVAGGLSAKTKGIYQIAFQFKDGKKSLVEVDDKIYNAIITGCFR